MSDDETKLWARLKHEVAHPDPSISQILGEPEPEEPDPFAAYADSEIRTHLPEGSEVLPSDVFEWNSDENGGYYVWRRGRKTDE